MILPLAPGVIVLIAAIAAIAVIAQNLAPREMAATAAIAIAETVIAAGAIAAGAIAAGVIAGKLTCQNVRTLRFRNRCARFTESDGTYMVSMSADLGSIFHQPPQRDTKPYF